MPELTLFQPASVEEARALLLTSPTPVDSPTQRRLRTALHLDDTLTSGRRRADWVWAVRRGDGPPLGVVGGLGTPYPDGRVLVLDHLSAFDDPDAAATLVSHATTESGCEEAGIFAPTGTSVHDASLTGLVRPLEAAGWRLLVERRHYEFEPAPDLAADRPTSLTFERLTDPEDPRLAACHREVMRDTLDAHDAALVQQVGFEEACRRSLAFLLESDPVDRLHLAHDPAGQVVGMVSGVTMSSGRAFVLFVGVPAYARGHGYGAELLAWQTRRLLAEDAMVLIADTDNTNVPMARAFADVGWEQTETRIDLVRGG
jgi:Acetyltransferase (GNAT) family